MGNELDRDEIEADTITLTLEDDSELECVVLANFAVEDQDYVALLPVSDIETEDGEVFLYRFNQLENDEIELLNIESDDEFEVVSEAFDQILDEAEFNDLD